MPPPGSNDGWPQSASWDTPGYGWPPPSGAEPDAAWPRESVPPLQNPARSVSRVAAGTRPLPDPDECLTRLQASGATVERVPDVRGVEAPVILRGPVAGIEYWASDGRPLLLDCRLGFALVEVAPTLKRHGVTRVRFSGAYVYRTTRSGRLSHHAHGLAIDVHDITMQADSLTVKEHFARGAGCEGDVPVLNRIACDLGELGLFQELLTPDYNRDHHDHFHLAVPRPEDLSRGGERSARRAGAP